MGSSPCATTVDWNLPSGDAKCRTFVTLAANQTLDHCSNPTAGFICGPRARSLRLWLPHRRDRDLRSGSQCKSKIGVDAEIFYFDSNLNVVGVADAKVLRLPGANKGTRSSFKTVAGAVVANGSCTGIEGAARVVDLRARDSRYVK